MFGTTAASAHFADTTVVTPVVTIVSAGILLFLLLLLLQLLSGTRDMFFSIAVAIVAVS